MFGEYLHRDSQFFQMVILKILYPILLIFQYFSKCNYLYQFLYQISYASSEIVTQLYKFYTQRFRSIMVKI